MHQSTLFDAKSGRSKGSAAILGRLGQTDVFNVVVSGLSAVTDAAIARYST
jgi:hypothetical protein